VDQLSSRSIDYTFPTLESRVEINNLFLFQNIFFSQSGKQDLWCQNPDSIVQIYLYVLVIMFIVYLRDSNLQINLVIFYTM